MLVGTKFPLIRATTLAGSEKTLPDAVKDNLALIIIAFERTAQSMIDSWMVAIAAQGRQEDILIYEIPMIDSVVWRAMRRVIDGGMRSGIPVSRYDFVMTYYGDTRLFREELEMDDRTLAYLFLLDHEGIIRWSGRGFCDSESLNTLLRTIDGIQR
jgi:hypothetical protein